MKNLTLFIMLFAALFVSFDTNAQTLNRTTVRWSPDTLNFGEIYAGTIVLDSFRVTNTGVHPYFVKDIKTSCDCTVLRYPKQALMPGQTAAIRIEFDSGGKAGMTIPGIILYDNSIPNQRHILYLKGVVKPRKLPKNANQ